MAGGSVNLIEKHLEKGVLGLTVLFLLAIASLYLIRSPNQMDYGGQKVGPDELAAAIQRDADSLRSAIDRVEPPDTQVEDSSETLRQQHAAGIADRLPSTLRLAADFGQPLPELSEEEEASGDIVLVTPLAPSVPLARTGRNLVIRQRPQLATELSEGQGPQPDSDEPPEPVEIPWVTIASYFDFNAQQTAMTKAGYATYRSKVYIAGVDVQRQVTLPDGSFSDWQDVRDSLAMPRLEFPTPEFDELTGNMINKDEVDRTRSLVKAYQALLMQPPFYQTLAGDAWKMPPLEGYPDQEELTVAGAQPEEEDKSGGRRPRGSTYTTGRRLGGGGGAISVGSGAVSSGGGGPGRGSGQRSATQDRQEGREKAQDDLHAAEDAYRNSQDDQAQRLAQDVLDNEYARAGDEKQARKIINSIRTLRQQEARESGTPAIAMSPSGNITPTIAGAPTIAGRGGPGRSTGPQQPRAGAPAGAIVSRPDKGESLAVWFHDDTVEAGKTYRYRMRVKLWNRYVGKMRALKDPEQAKQAVLVGDWSLPGESVTVTPSTYFFLSGATASKDGARMDVWKWSRGSWLKQSFNVGVGDVIGNAESVPTGILDRQTLDEMREEVDFTTGAVVLDLRFDEPVVRRDSGGKGQFNLRPTDSLVLVYLDPADGTVKERVQIFDRNDPLLRRLKEKEL